MATGFGLGYSPWAPGTVGTLLGVAIVLLSNHYFGWIGQSVLASALAVFAIPVCEIAERHVGQKDPHCIVADEYMTFPICMIGLPLNWWILGVAFVSNRVFDIIKPPPARGLQELHGGFGIVIDDVFAALYSLALNHAVYRAVVWFLARA